MNQLRNYRNQFILSHERFLTVAMPMYTVHRGTGAAVNALSYIENTPRVVRVANNTLK
jgi:hypothetical protein